jgi:hypothetical protein
VPQLVAGRQLTRISDAPIAWPSASPAGSSTMPVNGSGSGVGTITPGGVGTSMMWVSMPST